MEWSYMWVACVVTCVERPHDALTSAARAAGELPVTFVAQALADCTMSVRVERSGVAHIHTSALARMRTNRGTPSARVCVRCRLRRRSFRLARGDVVRRGGHRLGLRLRSRM